jgi:UDP-sugar pyrophosphorylase
LLPLILAGEADAEKRRLLQQLSLLDANYHGGLVAYIHNAKQLLADSKEGEHNNAEVDLFCS